MSASSSDRASKTKQANKNKRKAMSRKVVYLSGVGDRAATRKVDRQPVCVRVVSVLVVVGGSWEAERVAAERNEKTAYQTKLFASTSAITSAKQKKGSTEREQRRRAMQKKLKITRKAGSERLAQYGQTGGAQQPSTYAQNQTGMMTITMSSELTHCSRPKTSRSPMRRCRVRAACVGAVSARAR